MSCDVWEQYDISLKESGGLVHRWASVLEEFEDI